MKAIIHFKHQCLEVVIFDFCFYR